MRNLAKFVRTVWPLLLLVFQVGCSENTTQTEKTAPPFASPQSGGASSSGRLQFEAPADWVQESPSSNMRLAQFRLPQAEGDSEDAELVVYYFGGGGGSTQANVDRWISQFSQPGGASSADAAEISERDTDGIHLTIVDVSGTYNEPSGPMMARTTAKPNYRMLAAVVEGRGGPWFLKLTGPEATVDHWEDSFQEFLNSLRIQG